MQIACCRLQGIRDGMPVALAQCRKVRWSPKNARQTTRDATPSIEGKIEEMALGLIWLAMRKPKEWRGIRVRSEY